MSRDDPFSPKLQGFTASITAKAEQLRKEVSGQRRDQAARLADALRAWGTVFTMEGFLASGDAVMGVCDSGAAAFRKVEPVLAQAAAKSGVLPFASGLAAASTATRAALDGLATVAKTWAEDTSSPATTRYLEHATDKLVNITDGLLREISTRYAPAPSVSARRSVPHAAELRAADARLRVLLEVMQSHLQEYGARESDVETIRQTALARTPAAAVSKKFKAKGTIRSYAEAMWDLSAHSVPASEMPGMFTFVGSKCEGLEELATDLRDLCSNNVVIDWADMAQTHALRDSIYTSADTVVSFATNPLFATYRHSKHVDEMYFATYEVLDGLLESVSSLSGVDMLELLPPRMAEPGEDPLTARRHRLGHELALRRASESSRSGFGDTSTMMAQITALDLRNKTLEEENRHLVQRLRAVEQQLKETTVSA